MADYGVVANKGDGRAIDGHNSVASYKPNANGVVVSKIYSGNKRNEFIFMNQIVDSLDDGRGDESNVEIQTVVAKINASFVFRETTVVRGLTIRQYAGCDVFVERRKRKTNKQFAGRREYAWTKIRIKRRQDGGITTANPVIVKPDVVACPDRKRPVGVFAAIRTVVGRKAGDVGIIGRMEVVEPFKK